MAIFGLSTFSFPLTCEASQQRLLLFQFVYRAASETAFWTIRKGLNSYSVSQIKQSTVCFCHRGFQKSYTCGQSWKHLAKSAQVSTIFERAFLKAVFTLNYYYTSSVHLEMHSLPSFTHPTPSHTGRESTFRLHFTGVHTEWWWTVLREAFSFLTYRI